MSCAPLSCPCTSRSCLDSSPCPHPGFSGVFPTPLLLQGMPQFTFACFCGLHGFCKMKRKKEEASAEQETAV
ncbi:bladder cancer associated transcript 1 [Heliangelus exortis]|uniref:bladder cancer associated transcript 1 n=1 Tax=Heliangelus exortis TaxID=472823 RepID=UPI003A91D036